VIDRQIHRALLECSTQHLEYQIWKAALVLFSMIAGGFGLRLLQKLLRTRDKAIKAQQAVEATASSQAPKSTAVEDNPAVQRLTILSALQHQSNFERLRRVMTLLKWLAFWGQMILWVGGTFLILSLLPILCTKSENGESRFSSLLRF
jgi:hypothetical protein